jgi:hypothetical protein
LRATQAAHTCARAFLADGFRLACHGTLQRLWDFHVFDQCVAPEHPLMERLSLNDYSEGERARSIAWYRRR